MRQFASSGFRIWNLSVEAKVIYTAFGLFALLALASSMLLYEDFGNIRTYYAGESAPARVEKSPSAGPEIALPPDGDAGAPAAKIAVAMPYRKLLEVSHFHLFTVPVFLLIVAHLFMLTGLSSRAKVAWIVSAWGSALVHLAAPWAMRYGGGKWAWLYVASGAGLGVTSTVLTVVPMWSMWFGKRGEPKRGAEAAS